MPRPNRNHSFGVSLSPTKEMITCSHVLLTITLLDQSARRVGGVSCLSMVGYSGHANWNGPHKEWREQRQFFLENGYWPSSSASSTSDVSSKNQCKKEL